MIIDAVKLAKLCPDYAILDMFVKIRLSLLINFRNKKGDALASIHIRIPDILLVIGLINSSVDAVFKENKF